MLHTTCICLTDSHSIVDFRSFLVCLFVCLFVCLLLLLLLLLLSLVCHEYARAARLNAHNKYVLLHLQETV
jgi:hypothetical protein